MSPAQNGPAQQQQAAEYHGKACRLDHNGHAGSAPRLHRRQHCPGASDPDVDHVWLPMPPIVFWFQVARVCESVGKATSQPARRLFPD